MKINASRATIALLAAALAVLLLPAVAFAGQASSGDLLFYPCTDCHPVIGNPPAKKLPNDFKGHEVTLIGHDKLGKGDKACLTCHDDPKRNPGKLITADGTMVDITGDISLVCYRCHSDKYKQFKEGTHGKRFAKCTASGCHDPHTPRWFFVPAVKPFVGVGFQTQVLPEKHEFQPLMSYPVAPAVETPVWFIALVVLGLSIVGGLAGKLINGRSKR